MPPMPLSTAIFVLTTAALTMVLLGWFWYFVIKCAIRDGIKEAGLRIESIVPTEPKDPQMHSNDKETMRFTG